MPTQTPRERVGRGLPALTAGNLCCLALLWFVEGCVAERHWLTTLLTYVPQHAFGVPAALLLAWSLARRRAGLLAWNAAACAVFAFVFLGVIVPGPVARPGGAPRVRIVTFNIHHGRAGAEKIAGVLRRLHPDVICLQEANPDPGEPDPLPPLAALLSGYQVARHRELATLSRFPIREEQLVARTVVTARVVLETEVAVGGRPLTVLNAHLATATAGPRLKRGLSRLPRYVRGATTVRSLQVQAILSRVEAISGPVVVSGDFNTPPRGLLYRRLTRRLQDAFARRGSGLGDTFPSPLPLLRIDYVFLGGAVRAIRCRPYRQSIASDHCPVVADLQLTGALPRGGSSASPSR